MSKSNKDTAPVSNELDLTISKTIRIAVSGDVFLTRLETEIIDTPDFQRLRGVRQLGSVNLVYPTALHTRFDHSLGTLAMADRMIRAIRDNTHNKGDEKEIKPIQEALVRLYALLHDVPHIPFGHTIEDELGIFGRHDKNPKRFERFFGEESDIGELIKDEENGLGRSGYERFKAIYRWDGKFEWEETEEDKKKAEEGKEGETEEEKTKRIEKEKKEREEILKSIKENDDAFVYDLVSNTVCADLLDYLQRDSYFCNLVLGLEYRFLNFLYLRKDRDVRRVFIRLWKTRPYEARRDTLTDLARLLEARYIVAERAYFHHAKIISGAMLGRAIQETRLAGELKEEDLYGYSDDILVYKLNQSTSDVAKRLAKNLTQRKLYKKIDSLKHSAFAGLQEKDQEENAENRALSLVGTPEKRKKLEDQLASEILANSGDVLIYAPDKKMNLKAAEMKVIWEGNPIPLKDITDKVVKPKLDAILDAHRSLWAIYLIAKPDLSEEQRDYLKKSFQVKFLYSKPQSDKPESQVDKSDPQLCREELNLYESLIDLRLAKQTMYISLPSVDFYQRRAKAAEELCALKTDDTWAEESQKIIEKTFIGDGAIDKPEPVVVTAELSPSPLAPASGYDLKSKFVITLRPFFANNFSSEAQSKLESWYVRNLSNMSEDEQSGFFAEVPIVIKNTPKRKLQQRPGKQPWSWILEALDDALRGFQNRVVYQYKDE